jgi:RNA recognition motif-containing protein
MEDSSPPPQRQYQNFRSTASNNWRVKDDTPRAEQPQAQIRYNRAQNGSGNHDGNSHSHSRNNGAQHSQGDDATPGTRLYVGNLLYTAQKPDIEELFKKYGFNVVGISISTDPFTGRNPSYCFVDVDTVEEAQRAMSELNGVDVLGRPLRVSPGVVKRQGPGSGGGSNESRIRDYEKTPGRPRGMRETKDQKGRLFSGPGYSTMLFRVTMLM